MEFAMLSQKKSRDYDKIVASFCTFARFWFFAAFLHIGGSNDAALKMW